MWSQGRSLEERLVESGLAGEFRLAPAVSSHLHCPRGASLACVEVNISSFPRGPAIESPPPHACLKYLARIDQVRSPTARRAYRQASSSRRSKPQQDELSWMTHHFFSSLLFWCSHDQEALLHQAAMTRLPLALISSGVKYHSNGEQISDSIPGPLRREEEESSHARSCTIQCANHSIPRPSSVLRSNNATS